MPGSVTRTKDNSEGEYGTILDFEEVFCQADEKREVEMTTGTGK